MPRVQGLDSLGDESVLSLVKTLSERVQSLESSLQLLEPRKRSALAEPVLKEVEQWHLQTNSSLPAVPTFRPVKYARTAPPELSGAVSPHEKGGPETNPLPVLNGSDAGVEDAATVLEFLAWGRLKDNSITNDLGDPSDTRNSSSYLDKDVIQSVQAWGHSPGVVSGGGYRPVKAAQISQIQDLLPSKSQVILLFEYHANWILFLHCSFHVTTFSIELDQFFNQDGGMIRTTNTSLQWASLLFAIICVSIVSARPAQIALWGFDQEEQSNLANQWYQASLDCLNAGRFQQNHSIYGVQSISTMTLAAHILGYSNSQSVLLAAAVRIGQSLGLHRLPRHNITPPKGDRKGLVEEIQKETGRRIWQQLAIQDWFSVPFSETYCVNLSHFSTVQPLQCDEETLQPLSSSAPAITSYGNFLFHIAALMPELLDKAAQAQTISTKYEQVLHFDKRMRDFVTTQLPSCINGQMPTDPSWPSWVPLARRSLTVTAAHKIIMIHRKFLGMSFHDPRFAFTRKTCLAAAKTIINEVKQPLPDESPILWVMQAFSVAAAVCCKMLRLNAIQLTLFRSF